MNWLKRILVSAALASLAAPAFAQTTSSPAPLNDKASGAALDAVDVSTGVVLVGAALTLLLVVAVGVKLYDRARKKEEDAAGIQARISDALMTDPVLSCFTLTPTVTIPMWHGDIAMVEISGAVPGPVQRQAAIDLALREALRSADGRSCRLVDRISVDPGIVKRAA